MSNPEATTCYFFRYSDFFRRKRIDAVIVGFKEKDSIFFYLCLNPYSENYKLLKTSGFISPFKEFLVDPIEQEKRGEAYIPDRNIEPSKNIPYDIFTNVNPMLQHLSEKYKLGRLVSIDFNSYFAEGIIKN